VRRFLLDIDFILEERCGLIEVEQAGRGKSQAKSIRYPFPLTTLDEEKNDPTSRYAKNTHLL
jgi:hypothetical protein